MWYWLGQVLREVKVIMRKTYVVNYVALGLLFVISGIVYCKECENARFGTNCQYECHCNDNKCNKKTGECTDGAMCERGWFGPACQYDCQPGKYGGECEHTCNCARNETCFVSTGGCPSGCAAGFQGDACQEECPDSFYGVNCLKNCSTNCSSTLCHHVTGYCHACKNAGKQGHFCDKDCGKGKYGQGCKEECSPTCSGGQCDGYNGTCTHGCQDGYIGPYCNESSSGIMANIPSTAGALAGVVVLIALFVGFVRLRRRRQRVVSKADSDVDESDQNCGIDGTESDSPNLGDLEDVSAGTVATHHHPNPMEQTSTSVSVLDLGSFLLSHDDQFFKNQFEQIPLINKEASFTVARSAENQRKSRYKDILAYDHSRVPLASKNASNEADYINASYVSGFKEVKKYIASQGPNSVMIKDFIRMLWEQRVEKVVMLTNLVEKGKSKCEKYWPNDTETRFGDITVKLTTTHVFANYTIRKLRLERNGEEGPPVTHYHYTSWPDKGVPINPWVLVDFQQRAMADPSHSPVVVHCSAGVGRTGTFIALCNVMEEAAETGSIDFYNTVVKLRMDRVLMVQTEDQYIFLHKAAQVALVCVGTTVSMNDITSRFDYLHATVDKGQSRMAREFEAVHNVCLEQDPGTGGGGNEETEDDMCNAYQNSHSMDNKLKNRCSDILPKDMFRAHLTKDPKNVNDYINAVVVPSFIKRDNQILTQLPLTTTVQDFWHLVTRYNVSLIVAFDMDKKDSDKTIAEYLPSSADTPFRCGAFIIHTGPATCGPLWEERHLTVAPTTIKNKLPILGPQLRKDLTHLTCNSPDISPEALLMVAKHVRSCRSTFTGRTVYMCRNGASYSGLVYVLCLLLDRMDNDHCLTVPLVVGAIKSIRPQVIPTMEHYSALYETLKRHAETTSVYSNCLSSGMSSDFCAGPSADGPPVKTTRTSASATENDGTADGANVYESYAFDSAGK